MASVNKWIGIGNLGDNPEVRYLPSGEPVLNSRIAINERWKDKSGNKHEHTEWVGVSFFGVLAEIAGKYLKKGSKVYVEGSLRTRKWTDKEGKDRYTTEIRVQDMQMLDGKKQGERNTAPASDEFKDDDIPF